MIATHRHLRYIARRGKLARRHGQIVTVLTVQKWQILVRFPDGAQAHIHPRFLTEVTKS